MTSHKNRRDCDVGRRDTAACPHNLLNQELIEPAKPASVGSKRSGRCLLSPVGM